MEEEFTIVQVNEGKARVLKDIVVREFPLTIILNGQELITLLCSPADLHYLAAGFLHSEGLIQWRDDIENMEFDEEKGIMRVRTKKEATPQPFPLRTKTTSGGRTTLSRTFKKIKSELRISPEEVFRLVDEFQHRAKVYRATGGTHAAAFCDRKDIVAFAEDIGRHNAVDKVLGKCLLEDLETRDHIFITSGRVSSEILLKVAKRQVPVLLSISAPTNATVRLASQVGLTVIGFVRGKRMNIYTGAERIIGKSPQSRPVSWTLS